MTDDGRAWESWELLEVYKTTVEEYRFQVRLNWNRTQYLFALNAALLAAGASLASVEGPQRPAWLVASIFLVGILASVHAIAMTWRQHEYYRSARDHMHNVGQQVGLGNMILQTTPGMRGARGRLLAKLGRVTWMHYGLFGVFVLLHAVGAVHVLT